jgi:hypothetical protein
MGISSGGGVDSVALRPPRRLEAVVEEALPQGLVPLRDCNRCEVDRQGRAKGSPEIPSRRWPIK